MPNSTPKTIEELKAWYVAHELPPERVTRFFIGKDIREAKAFGIYRDGDYFVVYKNKDDGTRKIRYEGRDEAYAVDQLYRRLKEEINLQKDRNMQESSEEAAKNKKYSLIAGILTAVIISLIIVYTLDLFFKTPNRGYYYNDDSWYYYQSGSWYTCYDDDWERCSERPAFADNYKDYYVSSIYDIEYDFPDFSLTEYYSTTDTDSSWSSSDTWDSDSTDWSSDW